MKVTALVPAFNEEKTIGKVVKILIDYKEIDEVMVVDDGSSDSTALFAKESGAQVLKLDKNQGKGAALNAGIKAIDNDIIIMLDGDLIGLNDKHLHILLAPVLNNECDMTVGVFNKGRGITDLAQFLAPNLSGQRAVRTSMIKGITNLDNIGYGVEVAINKHVKKQGKLKYVELSDLSHIMKEEKRGFYKGIIARLKMYWDILKITILSSKLR